MTSRTLPLTVIPNIPSNWILKDRSSDYYLVISVPSRSLSHPPYVISIDRQTGQMECSCPANPICSHVPKIRNLLVYSKHPLSVTHQTKVDSFRQLDPDKLARRYREMLSIFNGSALTDRQIAALLKWSINRVTPRRGELVQAGMIAPAGIVHDDETGRNVQSWQREG